MKTNDYYNALAPYYKYIYQDWEKGIAKQSTALDSIITEFFGDKKSFLDVSCGVGTQCLGLAELGYQVSASDLSEEEVKLAKSEAEKRGLEIAFKVADMRDVSKSFEGQFDIVLSADNSIPHLLDDEDILRAFKEFYALTNSDGGCVVTVRDYKNINPENKKEILNPRRVHHTPDGKIVMFDLWEFEGDHYDLNTYLVKDEGGRVFEGSDATRKILSAGYYWL